MKYLNPTPNPSGAYPDLLVLVSEHCKINTSIVTAEKIYRSAKHTTISVCDIMEYIFY